MQKPIYMLLLPTWVVRAYSPQHWGDDCKISSDCVGENKALPQM